MAILQKKDPIINQLSNGLYNGDITDFVDAMQAVMDGMNAETRDSERWNARLGPDEQEYHEEVKTYKAYHDAAMRAMSIYLAEESAMRERVVARLRELEAGDANMEQIAVALEGEDYSRLAW